jgi:hypothetical protein
MVLNKLERKDASDVVRRWFRRGIRKDPALKKEARYQEAFLAWFPFVRARLDAVGWVLGIREKKRKRGNRWETVKEPVERHVGGRHGRVRRPQGGSFGRRSPAPR